MLDVQWSRHSFNNLFATEHLATPASAYDTYCVTAPVDPRLPGGGGNQICGFTDLKPAYFGITPNDFVTSASKLGNVVDLYTGFDVNLNMRLKGGGSGAIGVSTGRERTDYCDIATLANVGSNTNSSAGKIQLGGGAGSIGSSSGYPSTLYCSITPPYQPDWKGFISYPLPWFGLRASGTWQNRIGPADPRQRRRGQRPQSDARPGVHGSHGKCQSHCSGRGVTVSASTRSTFVWRSR